MAHWIYKKEPDSELTVLKKTYGSLLGSVLWSRGFVSVDDTKITDHLNPRLEKINSPWTLKSMRESVDRILQAKKNNEKICIYSDYDMDGISGLSLLRSFLLACGFDQIRHYQPHRFDEGYGVHPKAIEELAADQVKVIITVDTGTTAHEAAKKSKELGIDLIITDHHQQVGEMPETPWVINPNQNSDTSNLNYLSGTGVAFYLCMALRQAMRDENMYSESCPEPDLRQWLDIYSLGTIGDVVDLKDDNRILIRTGLKQLAQTQRPGLRTLLDTVISPETQSRMTARDIAFSLIPKLNAASRMGEAQLSTELLLTNDFERAQELVKKIIDLNGLRSQTQDKIYKESLVQAEEIMKSNPETRVLCLQGKWHEGVLGIVAAKIAEKYQRPTIVLAQTEDNKLRGSMRTRGAQHCVKILEAASTHLERFGGHQAAAGMQLDSKNWAEFTSALQEASLILYPDPAALRETVFFDGELDHKVSIRIDEVEKLLSLEPFGAGNPEPLFLIKQIPCSCFEILKENHIKTKRETNSEMIGFGHAETLRVMRSQNIEHIDLLVTPEINTFRNKSRIQFRINSLRAHLEK